MFVYVLYNSDVKARGPRRKRAKASGWQVNPMANRRFMGDEGCARAGWCCII